MEITDNIQLAQVFAVHTYKKWNVGKCDNYVLIVYSPMNGSGVVSWSAVCSSSTYRLLLWLIKEKRK